MAVFVPIYLLCYAAILLIITFVGFGRQKKKGNKK